MTIRSRLILMSVLVGLALSVTAPNSKAASQPLVVLLGDSIRMNYQQATREALAGKAEVWSPKDNCRHTLFMLENLERWLKGRKPQVVHVNVGLHDMFLHAKTGQPRHTLETYEKNLRATFAKLDKLTDAKVIFALTTVVDEKLQAASKGYGRVVRRNKHVQAYNAAARKIAKESGVTVNDLNVFMRQTGPEKVLRSSDGIHLSPAGCRLLGNEVARVIMNELSK